MAAKRKIDWDRIEPTWRANKKSVMQIAAEYEQETGVSVSHTAINKHYKKLGIKRDLKEKVQAKADSMVSAAMVSGKVSIETTETDAEIINAEAMSVAAVQFAHRIDIPNKTKLVAKLFAEIDGQTEGKDIIEQARIALGQADYVALATAVEKMTSLPARIKGVADLVSAYKALIGLERQAFGITDKTATPGEEFTEIVRRIVDA